MTGPGRVRPDRYPVLVEQDVWEEFRGAVAALGDRWTAPSGRTYLLDFAPPRLEVALEATAMEPPPPGDEIDADLFELACHLYDAVGGEWSGEALRNLAAIWGWKPGDAPVRP